MKNKVRQYIKEHELVKKGDHIVVGVSGGADSMCLLHILKSMQNEYELKLTVAHINHGIRIEANEDAKFVKSFCKKWEITYKEHVCNIRQLAKENKCSEEEAGRNERYRFFEKVRQENFADKISVAHTMNDQAETMLMRLIRGSGITGLGAIMPKRDYIIRPLLILTREEVEEYCKVNDILYKQDITNKMDIYTRNRLRLQVLPLLKESFNPRVIESLSQTAFQLQQTEDYLEEQTDKAYKELVKKHKDGYSISISPFLEYHEVVQSRIVRKVIEKHMGTLKNIHYQNIQDTLGLFYKQSGKSIRLGKSTVAIREHLDIRVINERNSENYSYNLNLGTQEIVECNKKIELVLLKDDKNIQRDENTYTKNIDYDKINDNLQIRNRRPGDRILLKNGSKKLKDFFIDEKIPKTCRDDIALIADGNNIVWIVGYRLSEAYYVTGDTKQVLNIRVSDLTI